MAINIVKGLDVIDICVVSYRTPNELDRFIDSHQKYASESRLFIKVNDPDEQDHKVIKRWQESFDFHVTFGPNNGYARSVNLLVSQGINEVVGIFNADVVLTENSVQECSTALMSRPDWGVLGPRQVDDQNRLTAAGIFGTGDNPQHRAWKARDNGQCSDIRDDAVTIAGSAYFIKRDVWNELANYPPYVSFLESKGFDITNPEVHGGFLSGCSHFWEETFASYLTRHLGYKVVYYGPMALIHYWSRSGQTELNTPTKIKESRQFFRDACGALGILHD